jgi:hypothetical protein
MPNAHPLKVNPFEDNAVGEPRAVRFSVAGLNDEPLDRLVGKFARLTDGALPRPPIKASTAQLIVSPDAGYGKSHLLGRLFQRLGPQATLVYIRPFQDPERAWSSILLTTVQELGRPGQNDDHGATQLEAFAAGVLAHVAADFIDRHGVRNSANIKNELDYLREHPLETFGANRTNSALSKWLQARLEDPADMVKLGALLRQRGLELDGKEKAWLKVLAGYAFAPRDSLSQDAALTWLRGEPLEQDQAQALKLAAADNDGGGDASARQINDLSLRRLRGLCMLSSYYRPFVFCFDQTEFYGCDAKLTDALGDCAWWLTQTMPNQLSIVTTNATNWSQDLRPNIKPAYQAQFSPPIDLEGINLAQATELLTERLKEFQIKTRMIADFIAPQWLEPLFVPQSQIGVRRLLLQAAERYRSHDSTLLPDPLTIDEAFGTEINKVRAKPAVQQYSQDCLMWFAEFLVTGFDGVKVLKTAKRYFSVQWEWPDRSIYFAFEAGHHNARWRAIADEAKLLASNANAGSSIVFRTPDLKPIPGTNWTAARHIIDDAQAHGLRIVVLTIDEVSELHAARDFYSNALQGNIDFAPKDVLKFLKERFAPWFEKFSRPERTPKPKPSSAKPVTPKLTPSPPPANGSQIEIKPAQLDTVVSYMRAHMLVDIKQMLDKLDGEVSQEALLKAVESHSNLKAHPGPQTIVLQWRV